jgi:acetamidase/formamidase
MIDLLQKGKGLSRLDAYALASIVMDCRIGEMVAADKSVHCVVPKSTWVQR